ncbi:MAG: FUSC family protein [Mycobacteriaceae bacterium]|nr:FUSC family protein [Mycobacteriaceae bacterium]
MSSDAAPKRSLREATRRSLTFTGAPLLWGLAVAVFLALFVGGFAVWACGFRPPAGPPTDGLDSTLSVVGTVLPGALVTAFVVIAGLVVPKEKSAAAVIGASVFMLLAIFIAWSTLGSPVWSGVAMAAIMGLAALAVRQAVAFLAVGMVLSTGYFLFGVAGLARGLSGGQALLIGLVGAGAGIAMLLVLSIIRRATGFRMIKPPPSKPAAARQKKPKVGWFAPGPVLRYAMLRAVLLGVAVGFYAATGDHNLFWVLLTIWIVLQPEQDNTFDKAVRRVSGVMLGCLVLGGLSQVVPAGVVLIIAVAAMFVGTLFYARSYAIFSAGISFLVVALFGSADNNTFVHWAGLRIVDTIIGVVIAIVAYQLVLALPDRRKAT